MHVLAHGPVASHRPLPAWAWVAFGGLALGGADLAFAALYWFLHGGMPPMRVAQGVASWVLGTPVARAGGAATAFAGFALYCAIVGAMVGGYLRIAARWPRVHAQAWFAGSVYGLAMYALLFRIVLPLFSAATPPQHLPLSWTVACLAAYAGIGIGCACIARAKASHDA